jgi:hypothetical protein
LGLSFNFRAQLVSFFVQAAYHFIFQLIDLCHQVKVGISLQQKTSLLSQFEGFIPLYDSYLKGLQLW